MALDMLYRCVPDDCELLDLVKQYQDDEWLFSFLSLPHEMRIKSPQYEHFYVAQDRLLADHKGIEERKFITRRWDTFWYLLSDARRNSVFNDENDKWRKIIIGDVLIVEDGSVRQMSSLKIIEAAELLEKTRLDPEYFNVEAMIARNVYTSIQYSQSEETFQHILADFEKLKAHYKLASEHGEGVITQLF